MLKDILKEKGLSVYRVSKDTGIAYSTIDDIVIEKTKIKNTSVEVLYRLSRYLQMTMEEIYLESIDEQINEINVKEPVLEKATDLESKASADSVPQIGIWWWTGDKIIGVAKSKETGSNIDGLIHYSETENHVTLWKKVLKESLPEKLFKLQYDKGFKSLYRGRVYFDPRTACYEITCSKYIIDNEDFKKSVIDFFNLDKARKEFVSLHHYENLRELTGNDAVDADYFDSSF